MEKRRLGNSGLLVSEVGLGCNNFGQRLDAAGTLAVVDAAIDVGIDLFDTADMYGSQLSEVYLGQALKGRRDEVIVATKCGYPMGEGPHNRGASRRYVISAVEASLRRLETDYIDLYQIHLPDALTPIDETLRALDDCVRQGKIRYIGHSNFAGWQIADAHWTAQRDRLNPFVTAQNHMSLLERDVLKEVIPACERFGLGMLPYFPLASGLLTGKYQRGVPAPEGTRLSAPAAAARSLHDDNFDRVEKLDAFARGAGPFVARVGIWLAAFVPVRIVGDRRRDAAGTGPGQRRSIDDAPFRRRDEGNRRTAWLIP